MTRITVERSLTQTRRAERNARSNALLTAATSGVLAVASIGEFVSKQTDRGTILGIFSALGAAAAGYFYSDAKSSALTAANQEGVLAEHQLAMPLDIERGMAQGLFVNQDPLA